eukprot:m.297875 g.297875  ORF g.297875 m.297875 type:complete len:3271 (+) comp40778_c0_seq3:234-10046(+)
MASQNGFLELLLSSLVYAWLFVNLLQVSSPFGTLALTVNCTSGFSRNGNECILLPPLLVENLAFGEVADTFVILTWEDPNPSGIVSHFRVIATLDCHIVVNKLTVNLSSNVTGLTSGTNYNFEVFAENAASKSFISNPKAPAAPFDVTVDQISANDITLSWNASVWNSTFPCTSSEYSIYYANLDTNGRELEEKVPGEQLSHNVNGLSPYTRYSFQIAFILGSGSIQGDRSPPIIAQTDQAVPTSPPRNISAIVTGFNLSISYILVSWHPPNQSEIPGVLSGFTLYARPADNFGVTYIENINGNETTTNYSLVLAVEPFTTYNITVSASTEAGEGPEGPIPPLTIERRCTSLRPGSPTNVAAESRGVDSLLITWDPPVETYGRILSYRVLVCGPSTCHTYAVDGATTTVLATSLDAPAFHHVFVFAQTGNGEGESACSAALTGQTVSAPSAPPQNASVVANSSTSFSVSWQRPPEMMRNGIIRMYIVRYNNTDDGKAANWTVGGDSLTALVTGLNEYSNYSVSVSAFTVAEGPSSSPIAVTTYEDVPSEPPRNFNVTPTCEGCIPSWLFLQWEPPPFDDQNGIIISYEIYYNGSEFDTDSHQINVSGDARSFTLKNLEQYVIYDVMIRAYTSVGPGPFSILTVRTLFERSLAPTIASVENISSTSLRVTWINPPLKDINGIYNGTEVQYSCGKTWCLVPFACHKECNGGMEFSQNMSEVSVLLTNLESYSCYFVSARFNTRNDAGQSLLGGSGSVYVTTAEDRPSGTISELTVADVLGEAELILDWNEINCTDINGLLHGYVIFFREANKSKASNVTIAPNATNFTLTNLTNFTMYYVWLQALNGAGRGPSSQVVQKRTDGNFLPPINVQAVALGPFAARMTWDPPAFGIRISGYRIQYMKADALNASFLDVNQTQLEATFKNLKPFRWYTFKVAAKRDRELEENVLGPFSVEVTAKAHPSTPGVPLNLTLTVLSSSSINVSWEAPAEPNGIITAYFVTFYNHYDYVTVSRQLLGSNATNIVLETLFPFLFYSVYVQAATLIGNGSRTPTEQVRTMEDTPSRSPRNLTVSRLCSGCSPAQLRVQWDPPPVLYQNGVLQRYVIYFEEVDNHGSDSDSKASNVTVSSSATNFTLTNLKGFTLYSVRMQAFTSVGGGPLSEAVQERTSGDCNCFIPGSKSHICDNTTGQCLCNEGAKGLRCDTCLVSGRSFQNISECHAQIDYTPFNCLTPLSGWTQKCEDVALPSKPAAILHASATILAGDSLQRDHVTIYWNGWTCLFSCSLTYTWTVHQLVRQGSLLVTPSRHFFSHRLNHQPVVYPISVHLPPGINVIEVSATNERGISSVVRRLFLVDDHAGSKVMKAGEYPVQFPSADYGYWQTDQNSRTLSISWENHFYNTYIKKNPWLLFPVETVLTGFNIESPPLSFSGVKTFNHSGITSFTMDFYQKMNASSNVPITSENFTALTKEWTYNSPRHFVSGEWYEVNVKAWDIFGHAAVSGASVYMDFTPPSVTKVTVWQRNQRPIRDLASCSDTGTGSESVFTLEFTAVDTESGIENVDWTIGKSNGTIRPQTQFICSESDESCYCATDGVCILKTYTARIDNAAQLTGRFNVKIQAKSRSGLTNTTEQEVETRRAEGAAPELKTIDIVSSRSLRVSWTFSATAETFLVITCRKHLVEGRCVSCSEVSTPGKDKSVVVQNLRPATKYRIQIQAVLSDRSALSGTDQAILTEDVPERAPIDVIVSVLPGKQALVTWNLPELFYRNGIITGYVLEVEIEDALGRWVLAQAKITISSPKTNSTVENLNSGRKYRMSVAAATKIGLGPLSDPKEITTPEDVPDEPPTNVSLSLAETNSFRISWEGIPENGQNGVLRQYRIAYSPQNGKEAKKEVTVRATESSVMLTGLSPFTLYIVNVAGETSIGKGPFSGDILVRTSEDIPGPPSLGRIDALGATSISVSWIAPTEPRGLIQGYMVVAESSPLVGRRRRAVDPVSVAYFFAKSDESFKDLSNLSEASNYTIYVQANTSKGYGEKSKTSSIVTPKRIPGAPRDLNAVPRSSASIAVSWQAPSQGSPAIYLVSYLAVDPPGPKQNRTTTTPSVQINLLFPNTYYRIEVKAKDGNASSITFARTFEGVPGPLASFRVPEVSASSVLLEWEPPEAPNGRIGFAYVITNLATGISTTVKLQPDELGSLINNFFRWRVAELNGFTEYRFIMLAFNIRHDSNGEASDAQVVRTDQGKPGPPADVRVESTRRSSLLVSWSPPEKPNGIVTTYEVITRWANETGTPATFTVIHRNNPTARFQEVFGLEHPALYGVVIRAKTISGEGAGSKIIYRRTKFEDPNDRTPRNVTYSNFTSTDVTVMWVEPGQTTGLWNYTLKVFKDGFTPFGTPIFLDRNSTAVVVKNLTPYTLFSFEIVAGYNDGTLGDISDPLYVQTESSAPSSPPRNFTVESDNSSTILLNWISPPLSDLNGVLCGFVVRYWPSGSIAEIFKEEFSPEEHHGSLTELKPYTEYVVTVAAETCNARGEGPAASGQNRTQEGVPERPSVSVIARNSTWIRIRWTVIPNGVLSRIEVNFSSVDNNVSKSSNLTSGEVEFNDLQPYHIYTVRLRGYSGGGGGDVEVKNVTTCPAAPIGFPLIQRCETFKHGDNENGFRLDWTDVLERQWRGIPEDYHVFLNPGNSSESVDVNAPNWTLPYQKQANGSILSRTFILDTSVEANRWYTVTMAAKTMADDTLPICHDDDSFIGPANSTCTFYLHPPPPEPPTPTTEGPTPPILLLATVIPVCVLVVVLALLIICWCRYKRTRQGKADLEFINLQQMRQRGLYAADGDLHWLMTWPTYDKYQFPRDRLKVEGELGEGQFGKVYLAWAVGLVKDEERTHVAVKTMKRGSSRETAEDFRKEMEIMMDFDHPNIVRLLGVCTREEPLYLITELMEHGDLKDFIRKARASELQPRPQLSLQELIDIASQAAAGVAYLASSKFVHRDIAGRNCLVGRNKDDSLVVKISDFGMARDVYQDEYYRRKGGALPIRWMAPEAITDGKYTVESDVWSLGVLLWETFSFGYQPYFGQDNEKVIGGVIGGTLCLQCPPLCPESVYYLMKRCWERSPAERISAEEVADSLEEMLHLSKEESQGDYGLVLDRKYQFSLKNRKPRETSLSYLDMSSAEGNPPPSSVPEYIPMSPGTPAGTKLGIQFEEDPLLPNASEGYLDMKPSTVSKLEPAKSTRRNEYVPDPVQVNDGKFDAEVKTEEIDAGYQDGEAFENPGYCSVPNGKEPITYL